MAGLSISRELPPALGYVNPHIDPSSVAAYDSGDTGDLLVMANHVDASRTPKRLTTREQVNGLNDVSLSHRVGTSNDSESSIQTHVRALKVSPVAQTYPFEREQSLDPHRHEQIEVVGL